METLIAYQGGIAHQVMVIIHVLLFVYWLGGDLGGDRLVGQQRRGAVRGLRHRHRRQRDRGHPRDPLARH